MTEELREKLQASLGDAYVIERELAPGGMSRLFLATEASLDRQVVIKLLPPDTASEVSAARFQREVLLAARLQHPHILPVLSVGTAHGLFYYVMPYVAGESMRHRLERGFPFPVPEALRILREIADALSLAHDRGIVHRDIKPANILLQEGHAVVTDFGIARAMEASRLGASARLTQTGVGIGTLGYMSPEQLSGEPDLDARADVYALAVVAYEMITGKPPFSGPTAQAIVTAHLTEPPPPIETVVPDVPPEISAVIAKALAKSPDDRYRSASEFRDALDLQMTTAFAAVPRRRSKRMRVIGAAATAVAIAAAAAVYAATKPTLDPDYVVVLPFNVRNVDSTMRQGMMDVLERTIPGGWVKTVSPSRYIGKWTERADQETAVRLGERTSAGLAIYGSVDAIGRDSLQVSVTVVNVAQKKKLGVTIQRTGAKEDLLGIARELAVAIRKELGRLKPIAAFRNSWLEQTNLPALQAFLVGEQFYRRSAWDSAMAYYERAIDADSGFALAQRHAGLVVSWRRSNADSMSRAYLQAAGRFNHGLPPRDSLLVLADSIRSTLALFETDTAYYGSVKRLMATLRFARDSFPADPEVWLALGEAYFHYGFGAGLSVSEDTILAAFDHAIQLDSGFTPSYIHTIELALTQEGRAAALRYADRYLALAPADQEADGVRIVASLLRDGVISGRVAKVLDTMSQDAIQTAWLIARRFTDSSGVAVRLLESRVKPGDTSTAYITDPGLRRVLLVNELAYNGRMKEAFDALGTNIGPREASAFGVLVALGAVPVDTVAVVFARMLHDPGVWFGSALPWWAAQRDTASLLTAVSRVDSQFRKASGAVRRRDWAYRASAVRAYLSWGRRSPETLGLFRQLPDSLCMPCYLDRLTKARLFDSVGLHAEAERFLGERPYALITPLEIRAAQERGMIAERLQHYELAVRSYAVVARAWASGDASQRDVSKRALAKVEQLGGDQPRSARLSGSDR